MDNTLTVVTVTFSDSSPTVEQRFHELISTNYDPIDLPEIAE